MSDSEDGFDDSLDVPDETINPELDDFIDKLEEEEAEAVSAEVDVGKDGGINESELDLEFLDNEPTFISVSQYVPETHEPTQQLVTRKLITGDARTTCFYLQEEERAMALAYRATMISRGEPPLHEGPISPDPIKVAEEELRQGVCPLLIYRKITDSIWEVFTLKELSHGC